MNLRAHNITTTITYTTGYSLSSKRHFESCLSDMKAQKKRMYGIAILDKTNLIPNAERKCTNSGFRMYREQTNNYGNTVKQGYSRTFNSALCFSLENEHIGCESKVT